MNKLVLGVQARQTSVQLASRLVPSFDCGAVTTTRRLIWLLLAHRRSLRSPFWSCSAGRTPSHESPQRTCTMTSSQTSEQLLMLWRGDSGLMCCAWAARRPEFGRQSAGAPSPGLQPPCVSTCRHHIHMNATKWLTLTEFVKHLGKTGKCRVDETPKGWFISIIQTDPMAELSTERRVKRDR